MRLFIDFEASSLAVHSHPIEVGWCDEDGVGESHLIRPLPDWHDWNPASQAVHGITREQLAAEGRPVGFVAARLAAALGQADQVCSDCPAFDLPWLRQLLVAAGLPPTAMPSDIVEAYRDVCQPMLRFLPRRRNMDVDRAYDAAKAVLSLRLRRIVEDVQAVERARNRIRHRALPDAQGLAWTVRELRSRIAAAVGG